MSAPARVLIVRFSSLGDVVLTTPLVRALRHHWPGTEIVYATDATYAPLLTSDPALNRVIGCPRHQSVRRLARELAAFRPTLGIDLHDNARSRALRTLVRPTEGWGVYRRQRLAEALAIWTGVDRLRPGRPVAHRYFSAVEGRGVHPSGLRPRLHPPREAQTRWASQLPPRSIALAPGARHATKQWPATRWRRLADRLRAEGWTPWGIGLANEAERLPAPHVTPAYGIGLADTAALLGGVRLAVTHDSGLMHVAHAVGTPAVALFGPTVTWQGFAPTTPDVRVVERPLRCRPCTAFGSRYCPTGHHGCMDGIDVDQVLRAVSSLS